MYHPGTEDTTPPEVCPFYETTHTRTQRSGISVENIGHGAYYFCSFVFAEGSIP